MTMQALSKAPARWPTDARAPLRMLPGDCLEMLAELPDHSVQCVVTSPPYFNQRDYSDGGGSWPAMSYGTLGGTVQVPPMDCPLGWEETPEAYVGHLVAVFREVRRVLRKDGTLWLNLGDTSAGGGCGGGGSFAGEGIRTNAPRRGGARLTGNGIKNKDLLGIPWMVAFALRADGWFLRSENIWNKPNPMPESVCDRPTRAHEQVFLLSVSKRYHYDADAIKEPAVKTDSVPRAFGQAGGNRHGDEGRMYQPERPQLARARELARKGNLTDEHIAAIRALGLSDAGKNRQTQTGTGRNDPQVRALAQHAKAVLGGYYREFLLSDQRNKRSVWTIPTVPFKKAHFAVFPPTLARTCILAGCPVGGVVLDVFAGSGTTGLVALEEGRRAILIEKNPAYLPLIHARTHITPSLPMDA